MMHGKARLEEVFERARVRAGGRMRQAVMVVVVAACLGACSFTFVNAPPAAGPPAAKVHCTASYALPIIDGVVAALGASVVVRAGYESDAQWKTGSGTPAEMSRGEAAALYGAIAALAGASAYVGSRRVGACRRARAALEPPVAPPPPPQPTPEQLALSPPAEVVGPPSSPVRALPAGPRLTPDERKLLEEGEISNGAQAGGIALALFVGFGTGQAFEGRTAWPFAAGEGLGAVMFLAALQSHCSSGVIFPSCNPPTDFEKAAEVAGAVLWIGFHLVGVGDAAVGPVNHNHDLHELEHRIFIAPTQGGAQAGMSIQF